MRVVRHRVLGSREEMAVDVYINGRHSGAYKAYTLSA